MLFRWKHFDIFSPRSPLPLLKVIDEVVAFGRHDVSNYEEAAIIVQCAVNMLTLSSEETNDAHPNENRFAGK